MKSNVQEAFPCVLIVSVNIVVLTHQPKMELGVVSNIKRLSQLKIQLY